jgi:hypothetical protein
MAVSASLMSSGSGSSAVIVWLPVLILTVR